MRYKTRSPFFTGITSFISIKLFVTPDFSEKTLKATWLAVSNVTFLADRVIGKRREEKRREEKKRKNNSSVNCVDF
jgi:hypothetical protein